MEFARAPKRLTVASLRRAFFRVVHKDNGEREATLKLAQICEHRRHFVRRVFINSMETHEGIEDQHHWPQGFHRFEESSPVIFEVETKRRCGDDLDID